MQLYLHARGNSMRCPETFYIMGQFIIIGVAMVATGLIVSAAIGSLTTAITKVSEDIKWFRDYIEYRSKDKWDDKFYDKRNIR